MIEPKFKKGQLVEHTVWPTIGRVVEVYRNFDASGMGPEWLEQQILPIGEGERRGYWYSVKIIPRGAMCCPERDLVLSKEILGLN